jgi:uncharacterized membrane protein
MARRLLVTTFLILALAPAAAQAVDSHAPKGARGDWLPTSEWVMSSWLPFDEAGLDALLHTNRADLKTWLNDSRSLGQLAAKHGLHDQRALADALVAPRLQTASPTMRRTLRSRAMDMLTQPHLARHVLFHIYHTPAIPRHAQEIFGMRPTAYRKLRDSGWTPMRIAAAGRRTFAQSRDELRSILVRRGDHAACTEHAAGQLFSAKIGQRPGTPLRRCSPR